MRFSLKKLAPCLMAALLAAPVLVTGCKTQNTTVNNPQEPPDYSQWEHDTNRPHEDLNKRSPADQQEYHEWQQSHSNPPVNHPNDRPGDHPNDH